MTERTRVMQIMPEFRMAGAEIMCENLVYALIRQGIEVKVVSLFDDHTAITDRMERNGVKVYYLGKKKGLDLSMIRKLAQLFRQEKPNVIHTHRYVMQYAIPAAILAGVKHRVHTVHSIAQKEQTRLGKRINSILFRHHGVVPVALNEEVKRSIQEVYGLPEQRIPIIYNGVDLSKCQPKETDAPTLTFLHIGRFMDVKNHRLLLNAFARFVKRYPMARLQLIGEGELQQEMERLTGELGIAENVQFVGLQSNVYTWLHDADVFVLSSKYEGMPMTLIEAMGTGLPVIATRVGGIPNMVTDGEEGMLTELDEESLAAAMERMTDSALRRSCGEKARRRALAQFSSDMMAERYAGLYRKLQGKES